MHILVGAAIIIAGLIFVAVIWVPYLIIFITRMIIGNSAILQEKQRTWIAIFFYLTFGLMFAFFKGPIYWGGIPNLSLNALVWPLFLPFTDFQGVENAWIFKLKLFAIAFFLTQIFAAFIVLFRARTETKHLPETLENFVLKDDICYLCSKDFRDKTQLNFLRYYQVYLCPLCVEKHADGFSPHDYNLIPEWCEHADNPIPELNEKGNFPLGPVESSQ